MRSHIGIPATLFTHGGLHLVALAALMLLACGPKDSPPGAGVAEPCETDADCGSAAACAFQRCHESCQTSADCDLDKQCVRTEERDENVCQIEVRCERDKDCEGEQICTNGECRDGCATATDCVSGQTCGGGVCEGGAESVAGPATMSTNPVLPGDTSSPSADDTTRTPDGAPAEPKPAFTGPASKVDLLFVVDNSLDMAPAQELLAQTLPDLVARLLSPYCVSETGDVLPPPASASDPCSEGKREFAPLSDLHLAVITTSLGGYGAEVDCSGEGNVDAVQAIDRAELLGNLPRGAALAPIAAATGFLSWTAAGDMQQFSESASALVRASGEFGCNLESSLEAWYRFLVEPFPYTKIVRKPCAAGDTQNSCASPASDAAGAQEVNTQILNQRKQFLRPDSLLGIVMFSDENDCSFRASGQSWRLSQAQALDDTTASAYYYPAFRGATACSDPEYGPNSACCQSCGEAVVAANCPTARDEDGMLVAVGCELGRKFTIDDLGDHPNLRCFDQQRRFGVDYLYPVERYSTALRSAKICPFTDRIAAEDCAALESPVAPIPNPLFADLGFIASDVDAVAHPPRDPSMIFLAGIVGVPWQDVAVSADATPLKYRSTDNGAPADERINWDWLLGEPHPADGVLAPADPLMRESVTPRSGQNPATGEALAPPGSGYAAMSINGHEWDILDSSQLQYACVFPIAARACPSRREANTTREEGLSVPGCTCTDYPDSEFANPLCQAEDGSFDTTQRRAGAFPGLRQLQVLYDMGPQAVVASICPKSVDPASVDFGYRPALAALVQRMKSHLAQP